MADLLALLQSKAEEIDNESKKKEQELKEKQEQEDARERALAELRSGVVEKKRLLDNKRKVLEDKKKERELEIRKAMAATGMKIDITVSSEDGTDVKEGELAESEPTDNVPTEELDEEAPDEDTVLPGDMEKSAREFRLKKRRSTIKANDIEYEKGEGGVVTVGAATLAGLIDLLVAVTPPVQGLDLDHFVDVFVLTHTNFTQSTYLFDTLAKIFANEYKPLEKPIMCLATRARVLEVLHKWLQICTKDFHEESILRLLVDAWLAKVKATVTVQGEGEIKEKEEKVLALFDKFCSALLEEDKRQKALKEAKEKEEEERKRKEEARRQEERLLNIVSSADEHKDILLKYSVAMLAQQLTLVDFKLFSNVEFNEFFHCGWTKENKADLSPHLVKFIDRFNQLSAWVQTQIVTTPTVEGRVELLTRLINIGKEFDAMNNFQGMMLINAALNSSPILRLKNTWAALPEADQNVFNALMQSMSHHKNYMVYRGRLAAIEPPLVPFIAIHLSDLTFIDENEDKIHRHDKKEEATAAAAVGLTPEAAATAAGVDKKGDEEEEEDEEELLINFNKMELLSKVLTLLRNFQKVGYDRYQPSLYLQKYFGGVEAEEAEKFKALPEKEIYEWSLKNEPKSSHVQQASRKRGFSLSRNSKAKPPPLARSNSQKGLTEGKEEKKKKKKDKVKNNKYNTMNPKKSAKRGSVSDLQIVTNPLLEAAAKAKPRRYSEADLGSPGEDRKTPLMSQSASLVTLHGASLEGGGPKPPNK